MAVGNYLPPEQGLKHGRGTVITNDAVSRKLPSTRTRIETQRGRAGKDLFRGRKLPSTRTRIETCSGPRDEGGGGV